MFVSSPRSALSIPGMMNKGLLNRCTAKVATHSQYKYTQCLGYNTTLEVHSISTCKYLRLLAFQFWIPKWRGVLDLDAAQHWDHRATEN